MILEQAKLPSITPLMEEQVTLEITRRKILAKEEEEEEEETGG